MKSIAEINCTTFVYLLYISGRYKSVCMGPSRWPDAMVSICNCFTPSVSWVSSRDGRISQKLTGQLALYTYTHRCTHIYTQICTFTLRHTHIYTHSHTYTHKLRHTHTEAFTYILTYTHRHTHIYTQTHSHWGTHTLTEAYIHIHTYIYTQTCWGTYTLNNFLNVFYLVCENFTHADNIF